MPKKFDAELNALKSKLVDMGEVAQEMFQTSTRALIDRDRDLLRRVEELENKVDQYQVEIDDDVVRLMAVYTPVALDMRFVLMTARINTEIERIGDQAVNMGQHIELLLGESELKKLVDLPRMADIASKMVRRSLRAYRENSPEQAVEVIRMDDEVDALNDQIFRELLTYMSDVRNIKRSIGLIFIARALERIADHATNIAEEVVYMVRGKDIRHQDDPAAILSDDPKGAAED